MVCFRATKVSHSSPGRQRSFHRSGLELIDRTLSASAGRRFIFFLLDWSFLCRLVFSSRSDVTPFRSSFFHDLLQKFLEFFARAVAVRSLFDPRRCLVGKRAGASPNLAIRYVSQSQMGKHSRSPSLALLAEVFDYSHHLFATAVAVNHLSTHTHRHLLAGVSAKKALDKEMAHQQADKDTTITAVLLLGTILKVDKSQRFLENVRKLACGHIGFGVVGTTKGVVVKGHTIKSRN